MPRQGTPLKMVGFKADTAMIEAVERRARAEGLFTRSGRPARSEMFRLAAAWLDHMPVGWRPDGWKPVEPLAECQEVVHRFPADARTGDACLCGKTRMEEDR